MTGDYMVRAGLALVGPSLEPARDVCINVREGRVESIDSSSTCRGRVLGGPSTVVTPQPAVAHAHSADHAFPEYGTEMGLEELVAPPRGLKHRLLSSTGEEVLVEAIREYYTLAWRMGVGLLIDFREGGGHGCALARRALQQAPEGLQVLILGRPGPGFPHSCDGAGLPSPLDYEPGELARLASLHPSMVHVAETPRARLAGDLELALEAGFDVLVHGTHLAPRDIDRVAEEGRGLVYCVRSNMWHGVGVPHAAYGLERLPRVAVGTDNGAWMPPDPWGEARALLLLARLQGFRGPRAARRVVEALFLDPYRMVGEEPRTIVEGSPARMLVFNAEGWGLDRAGDLWSGVVKRLGKENLVARIDRGEVSFV